MEAEKLPRFTDISWRWIAYFASTVLLVGVVYAFIQEIELKQDVPCEIVSSSDVKITGHDGLVTEVFVQPGQQVSQGQPLFRLVRDLTLSSDGRPRPAFDEAMLDEQIASTKAQFQDRSAALAARLQAAAFAQTARERELQALGEYQARAHRIAEDARRRLARLQGVSDYVTVDRIEQAQAEAHQGEANIAQGDARRQALQAELETLRGNRYELDAQMRELRAQHAREVQDVRIRFEAARRDITVSAPRSGVVAFSSLVAGHLFEASDVALVIDSGSDLPLSATLRIPSRQRGFISEGQVIRIKLDAYPYARFGSLEARIDSISDTTMNAPEPMSMPISSGGSRQADYMAWASLRGGTFGPAHRPMRVLSGMRGTASVVVERRTIAEWVLEPVFQMIRG